LLHSYVHLRDLHSFPTRRSSDLKTIVLFGATHPFLGFMPFGQPFENALLPDLNKYPKLPTSVYGNKIVEGYQDVMRSISPDAIRSEEHTSELQSRENLVCRLLLE